MSDTSRISYNIDFLRKRASSLAKGQSWTEEKKPYQSIGPRLSEAKQDLREAYRVLSEAARQDQEISSASEWLIDNFYIIQEQLVQVSNDFPKDFQQSIPRLTEGIHKGLPRVYELALNLVLYTDYVVDTGTLTRFVQSYQEQEVLSEGEIWAIPIMIRLVLLEQLARKANRVLERKRVRPKVAELIAELTEETSMEPGRVLRKLTNWMDRHAGNSNERVVMVEMVNMLQSSGLLMDEEKRWIEFRFNQIDLTLDEALRQEAQEQSKLHVSIQNNIASLRHVSETDWNDFVEECSFIERMLRLDPLGIYPEMDFQTRDRYRKTVERLSRRSPLRETEVAEQVLLLTENNKVTQGTEPDQSGRSATLQHVGHYLLGDGYETLIKQIGYSMPFMEKLRRLFERHTGLYVGAVALHTVVLLLILWFVTDAPGQSLLISAAVLAVALFPALELSVTAVNRLFAMLLPPRVLPKMDYEDGVPEGARTIVVVPTMLTSPDDVRRQLESLEIRSLANPDKNLQFGLLTDFTDSDAKEKDGDKAILESCMQLITELNDKHSSPNGDKFFLFHRERQWNEPEGVWMGWERKRGKLEEFNNLLLNPEEKTSYVHVDGNLLESLDGRPVKFVITLDADTRLPPDSAKDLIRTAAHPLNRPSYNADLRRVDKGYGIIQPRISIPPDSTQKTLFARIFSGNVGIDPYSTAVSDIYQDLKGEAIFTGKGIYDVDMFHQVLNDRFPENRILSHDLIESTYMRAGLATDIELFDDYPGTYASFSKRNHRWARGDWQIAAWLFGTVNENGRKVNNPINLLSKWKIFDNLRRSFNPFFLTLFFIAGWFWLPGSPIIWTVAAFGILAFPIYVTLSADLANRPARVKWKLYLDKIKSNLRINTLQALSTLIILPHQALNYLDAIIRVVWRLGISKKWLLEWATASHTENVTPNSLQSYLKQTWVSPVLGLSILVLSITYTPQHWLIPVPFALLWIGAPFYAWWISQPIRRKTAPLGEKERLKLRTYARRTWFYFERFVNDEHSWLPPDNYQVDPPLPVTARTSPTNIGLALISTKVAYNMGYITLSELLDRTERTLHSLQMLETYKGHFYNWYETRVGEVLHPKYVSTVDSGNLAAGLITIKEAIRQVMNSHGINRKAWKGLEDTVRTVEGIFREFRDQNMMAAGDFRRIRFFTEKLLNRINEDDPQSIAGKLAKLRELKQCAVELCTVDLLPMRNQVGDDQLEDLLYWIERPLKQIESLKEEWQLFEGVGGVDTDSQTLNEMAQAAAESGGAKAASSAIARWKRQAGEIIALSDRLVQDMDFSFLYNKKRKLFYIGYNTEKSQTDLSTYDLLASEARIASYIAIAKGDVSPDHWFRLSRRLTSLDQNEILLSWGGTMFEYLMPMLFMRSFPNTLLSHTYNSVIKWQKDYGSRRGFPWGQSESAYYFLNLEMHYQYRAFGTPGLGLKRGLAEEYVIAPYASLLALMVDPRESLKNLEEIEADGGLGPVGFYDALDYTPSRLKESETHKVVKTYMAHHHGMGLVALENVLNDWSIHHYFHSDPQIKGCDLLLQEKIPRGIPIKEPHPIEIELEPGEQKKMEYIVEHAGINELDQTPPRLHMLSNGRYSTFITHAGTGSSKYLTNTLTAWEPDVTTDPLGLFFYIKDKESDKYWSSGHQPVKRKPDRYDTWFHNGKVITSRVDEWIETTTEVCVSSEHPMELRRLTLTNYSDRKRNLEITSYAEIVLNRLDDHQSHPAFSKLFLQTDYVEEHHAILAKRRPRGQGEKEQWIIHAVTGHDLENLTEPLQFETERSKFIGRGRTLSRPAAMEKNQALTGSIGNVSDPVFSLRRTIILNPGEKVQLVFGMGWADNREEAVRLADMIDNQHAAEREFDLASVYSTVEQEHLGVKAKQAHYFQKLASHLVYPNPMFRAPGRKLVQNRKTQSGLWAYGISGDIPLVVCRIRDSEQIKMVKTLLKAHTFWKLKGLAVDLLILNDHPPSYADEVQESIQQAIESSMQGRVDREQNGKVFLLKSDKITEEDLTLFLTVAVAVFEENLPKSLFRKEAEECSSFYLKETESAYQRKQLSGKKAGYQADNDNGLAFFNGYGGFSDDGSEYHILVNQNPETGYPVLPPAPWINVVSNPSVGFTVSERGAGYTWSENSRENKLTAWSNDPVCDPVSEAFYIRDEASKEYWSPVPAPCPGDGPYRVVHGFGYTRFEHQSEDLEQKLIQFAGVDDPVKISILTLRNLSANDRRLSLFTFFDWVMGINKLPDSKYITPAVSAEQNLLFGQNHYNNEFAGRIAFHGIVLPGSEAEIRFTTDRSRFIGRNRCLSEPAALQWEENLDDSLPLGGDSCAAFQAIADVEAGETITLISISGEAANRAEAENLFATYTDPEKAEQELSEVKKAWNKKLSRIQVQTPEKSLDLMLNGWLMYQNISSRLNARTAFYQAGGAFGYRDQLQDVMASFYSDPESTREQILLHASRQFEEGDVQHWWHPPTGRGIRSKISDDRLWLPYVTEFYIRSTGDSSILDEEVPYIQTRELREDEHEVYLQPEVLDKKGTIYEHCCKAIEISLKMGEHGLPLIGAGDWNDGMNRVGEGGKGESVWLGFFLYDILTNFTELCKEMGDDARAERYGEIARQLKSDLNKNGWDGEWYLRAFYDDGTPLGSADNDECRIDAISQAWSVISGGAPKERGLKALASVEKYLVSDHDRIIKLLTPAFDRTEKDPGYIRGYIPGVRENGGQYTHAALWTVKAFAEAGMGDKAVRYLDMINPVNHGRNTDEVSIYKVEPYVIAADVYGELPLTGQGGWTWYTGSAGWMYRVALESVLGISFRGEELLVKPVISSSWNGYSLQARIDDSTIYNIEVQNPDSLQQGQLVGTIDKEEVQFPDGCAVIPLQKESGEHTIRLTIKDFQGE